VLQCGGGFFKALLKRQPRYDDLDFRRFLRKYQWECLFRGKSAATRRWTKCS